MPVSFCLGTNELNPAILGKYKRLLLALAYSPVIMSCEELTQGTHREATTKLQAGDRADSSLVSYLTRRPQTSDQPLAQGLKTLHHPPNFPLCCTYAACDAARNATGHALGSEVAL